LIQLFHCLISLEDEGYPLFFVTAATVTNNLVGFIANIVAARELGVEGFGMFSLAFATATMIGAIGDFGFNLTMIRLFNKYQKDPEKQTVVLGTALSFKVLLFIFIVTTCWPLGSLLAQFLRVGSTETELFTLAVLTGGLLFFWSYLESYLESYRSFEKLTAYIFAFAAARFVCLLIAYSLSPENPLAWLVATYTIPVTIIILAGVVPKGHKLISITIKQLDISFQMLKEVLSYSKWVALSSIAYISLLNILRYILAICGSTAEVGIFSAGITFAMAFSMLNTSVRMVLFPKVTAFETSERMNSYLTRICRVAPYYLVFAAAGIGVLGIGQWFILGSEYKIALPVFLVTASALAVVIFLGLGTMLLHTMMKPEIDALVNVGRFGLMVLLAFILIPQFQAFGAAIAYAVTILAGELLMFRYGKA